jgi:hypothetical protein
MTPGRPASHSVPVAVRPTRTTAHLLRRRGRRFAQRRFDQLLIAVTHDGKDDCLAW